MTQELVLVSPEDATADQHTWVGGDDRAVDMVAAERAAADLLAALGVTLEADGLRETPGRLARAYAELFESEPFRLTTFPNDEGYDELVLARDIPFRTVCEHHLLPFSGVAHVGYLPGERILGLSKLARIVGHFAARPQTQERMTRQIADFIDERVEPGRRRGRGRGRAHLHDAARRALARRDDRDVGAHRRRCAPTRGARAEFLALAGVAGSSMARYRDTGTNRRPMATAEETENAMADDSGYVIVGASLAGAKAAETLRAERFSGPVVLIGTEDELPYERPPLSKDYLLGKAERDKIYVHAADWYAEQRRGPAAAASRSPASTGPRTTVTLARRQPRSATASCCSTTGSAPRAAAGAGRRPRRRALPAHRGRQRPAQGRLHRRRADRRHRRRLDRPGGDGRGRARRGAEVDRARDGRTAAAAGARPRGRRGLRGPAPRARRRPALRRPGRRDDRRGRSRHRRPAGGRHAHPGRHGRRRRRHLAATSGWPRRPA